MFLGYWNQPEATRDKFAGDWLLTGDRGIVRRRRLHLVPGAATTTSSPAAATASARARSRTACCATRPLRMAAVGRRAGPDPRPRSSRRSSCSRPGVAAVDDAGARDPGTSSATRLAAHEYPREIEYVDELPLTATGKVMRRELRRAVSSARHREQLELGAYAAAHADIVPGRGDGAHPHPGRRRHRARPDVLPRRARRRGLPRVRRLVVRPARLRDVAAARHRRRPDGRQADR